MPSVREFYVVEPPTSAEVRDHALEHFKSFVRFVIFEKQDIPKPEERTVDFEVAQIVRSDEGTLIGGFITSFDGQKYSGKENNFISIRGHDNEEPAEGFLVLP